MIKTVAQDKLESAIDHNEEVIANYNTTFHLRRVVKIIAEVQELLEPSHPANLPLAQALKLVDELKTFGRVKMREHPVLVRRQLELAVEDVVTGTQGATPEDSFDPVEFMKHQSSGGALKKNLDE